MSYLSETHLLVFLLELTLLLGLSRALGMLFSRFGQPAITAEILVGIALGPTLLGRVAPELHGLLFPDDGTIHAMLESLGWLGLLFFLLVTGLETDLSTAWRQRRDAAVVSLADLSIPMVIAFIPCLLVPDRYLADPNERFLFCLFVATIMTISALPVTARILQELNIYRSDTGLLIMCALTINDVAGWIIFAVILGVATGSGTGAGPIVQIVAATAIFTGLFLTVGRWVSDRALRQLDSWGLPQPGASLTFICLLGFLGGAITLHIGIHALFGFFIAGIMAGQSRALSEHTREVIGQMVRAVLVPVFFASIGLKIDFVSGFDLPMVLFILGIGIAGRYVGAWAGVRLTGRNREQASLISVAHVPGGEMQIVVGLLALEYAVITPTVFVAIVFGAIVTCVIAGPWMRATLRRMRRMDDPMAFFDPGRVVFNLSARSRDAAILELAAVAARTVGAESRVLADAALAREELRGTAIDHGVAVPHGRLPTLTRPCVAFGRSATGIDWNAADGEPVQLVFLILTPEDAADAQLQILRAVGRAMRHEAARASLIEASDDRDLWDRLAGAFAREAAPPSNKPATT